MPMHFNVNGPDEQAVFVNILNLIDYSHKRLYAFGPLPKRPVRLLLSIIFWVFPEITKNNKAELFFVCSGNAYILCEFTNSVACNCDYQKSKLA